MSVSLYASSRTLSDFFQRFESFIQSLDSKVRISLGSIGEHSARLVVEPNNLVSHRRYVGFKQEALQVGGALLTTVSVEQEGRAIEFRLCDWERGYIPVEFDSKMVHRHWLSQLANCFELCRRLPAEGDKSEVGLGPDHDVAYVEAIRHFEQATASVAQANEESVAAARAFFADATQELARRHAEMRSGFASEQKERRQLFERHLSEADRMDIREHAIVRRELLTQLDQLAQQEASRSPSAAVVRLRRRVSWSCGWLALLGVGLMGVALLGRPLAIAVPMPATAPAWLTAYLDPAAAWASGWMAEIVFVTGAVMLLIGSVVWLRHLVRVLRRAESHSDAVTRYRQDLLRMSWIAELYLDAADKQRAGEEMQAALPAVLLDRFSRSLFDGDGLPDGLGGGFNGSLANDRSNGAEVGSSRAEAGRADDESVDFDVVEPDSALERPYAISPNVDRMPLDAPVSGHSR